MAAVNRIPLEPDRSLRLVGDGGGHGCGAGDHGHGVGPGAVGPLPGPAEPVCPDIDMPDMVVGQVLKGVGPLGLFFREFVHVSGHPLGLAVCEGHLELGAVDILGRDKFHGEGGALRVVPPDKGQVRGTDDRGLRPDRGEAGKDRHREQKSCCQSFQVVSHAFSSFV